MIVEDHPVTRFGLRQIVESESDLVVCTEAGDAAEALKAFERQKPDLALVDISLPQRNGVDLLRDLKALDSGVRVLFVSMYDERVYAERVLRAGAMGYVMKDEAPDVLIQAIRTILGGEVYVSPSISAHIVAAFTGKTGGNSPTDRLTDRELQVYELIGRGLGNQDMGEKLGVSARTIEAHRANIKSKLGLKDGNMLVREAVRWVDKVERSGSD